MARLLVAALLMVPAAAGAQQREPDRWLGTDKVKHFAVSGFAYSISHVTLRYARMDERNVTAGAVFGASIAGIAKEFVDRRRGGRFSARDLVWDGAGAVMAGLLMKHTRR